SGVVRTVSVTFEPLAGDRSTREVEAAITRDRADRELRARFGQSETARQRQAAEATRRREAELAAGPKEARLSGFVTVTGRDPDDLRRPCAEVLEQAARARLELHRMYGQQADSFTFTLPLCRGLRGPPRRRHARQIRPAPRPSPAPPPRPGRPSVHRRRRPRRPRRVRGTRRQRRSLLLRPLGPLRRRRARRPQ